MAAFDVWILAARIVIRLAAVCRRNLPNMPEEIRRKIIRQPRLVAVTVKPALTLP
jgi:hypothetical protein